MGNIIKKESIIDILLSRHLISDAQMSRAQDEMKKTGLPINKALEKLGYISEEGIMNALAESMRVPYIDLNDYLIDSEIIQLVPEDLARRYRVIPLFKVGDTLTLAMANPRDIMALDEIRNRLKIKLIDPVLSTEETILHAIDQYYGITGNLNDVVKGIDKINLPNITDDGADASRTLAKAAEEAPVIKIVNLIIMQAIKDRASDIHVEPDERVIRVRFRIDGILHEVSAMPKSLQGVILSRIKILSKMDIAESRKPQDGRIALKLQGRVVDLRVSSFPTVHGENIVMRILDKSSVILGLGELGFGDEDLKDFEHMIRAPYGIILVTGPTGSGKTTTLYSALSTINSMEKNIITVEDPVEYELPLIRQTQVNPKAGITFDTGLRSILRQDPDIVMVGEIRDKETADVAIQASLTGHLVFSTLHTNDAPSAVTRLTDMGIEPFLISSSLIGVLAQRLVRTICPACKEKCTPSEAMLSRFPSGKKTDFFHGKGCPECKNSGYSGRIGIFEYLKMTEGIRKLVVAKASSDEIRNMAMKDGMRTLRDDGMDKVSKGMTTLEEIFRVTEE